LEDVEVRYEKPDGRLSSPVQRLSVERGDSVAVLVWVKDVDELVFVRQFRYPLFRHQEPWLIEIVAGSIDPDEIAEQAAVRELKEEVGVVGTKITQIAEFFGSPGSLSEKITIYFAALDSRMTDLKIGGLPGEDLEILTSPVTEVYRNFLQGKFHDGKTAVALGWFFLQGPGKTLNSQ
jgi:ADP-ribose pyrophosphatase